MSDDQPLSAEAVVIGESVLISLALAGSCYNDFPPKVSLEFLFPAHVGFYLLTYAYRNPRANFGHKLITPWFLIFGDLLLSEFLLDKSLPDTWLVLQGVFFLFAVALHQFPPHVLKSELNGAVLRGALFQLEAVYRAFVLVETITAAYSPGKGVFSLAFTMLLGICRLSVPALVYTLDQAPNITAATAAPLVRYLRASPLIVIGVMVTLRLFPFAPSENFRVYSEAHFFTAVAFLVWYGFEAVSFPEKEGDKTN